MLRIHVGSITETGWELDERVDALVLPMLKAVAREGSIAFTRPVHARIHAMSAGESVRIDGQVQTGVLLSCSRCLAPFESAIDVAFTATAVPDKQLPDDSDADEEIALTADEMDVIPYEGDSIDLNDEIAQQIIMALPFKPLCRESCKGLCGHCGIDLNRHSCQCRHQDPNNPFAILKTLSLPPKKE